MSTNSAETNKQGNNKKATRTEDPKDHLEDLDMIKLGAFRQKLERVKNLNLKSTPGPEFIGW